MSENTRFDLDLRKEMIGAARGQREDLAAYNEEYAKFFPTNKPARTTVEAPSLVRPGYLDPATLT